MEVPNRLIYNFLCDLKKKEIHPVERAEMMKAYLKEEGISQRELARELGMPHSTVQDWLDYGKLSVKEFNHLTHSGLSKKEIHKTLRGERNNTEIQEIIGNNLNRKLKAATIMLMEEINKPNANKETFRLIKDLELIIKRLKETIERKEKVEI
jgi:transcriptional regulator with XRE-family HTH domain